MSTEIELTGVTDGWTRVDHPNGRDYVKTVKICGCELQLDTVSEVVLTCDEYSIVKDYYPALLVEAPYWYTPPESSG